MVVQIDFEGVGRKKVLGRQSTSNLFNFDTEGYTFRPGASNFPVYATNVIQKFRSSQNTVFGKGFYSQVSNKQSGGITGANASFSFATPTLIENIIGSGSTSFVGTLSGAYRALVDGYLIALDNFDSADVVGTGVWTDTYDHGYSLSKFNYAFYKVIGRSDGSTTLTFSGTLPKKPVLLGNSSAANFKITVVAAGVTHSVTVANNGVTFTDPSGRVGIVSINWDTGTVQITFITAPDSGTDVTVFYQQDLISSPSNPANNAIVSGGTSKLLLKLPLKDSGATTNAGSFLYNDSAVGESIGYEVFTGWHLLNSPGKPVQVRMAAGASEDLNSNTYLWYPEMGDKVVFSFYGKNVAGSTGRVRIRAIDESGTQIPLTDSNITLRYNSVLSGGDIVMSLTALMKRFAIGLNLDGLTNLYGLQMIAETTDSGTVYGDRQIFVTGFHANLGDVLTPYTASPSVYYQNRPEGANPFGIANQVYTSNGDGTFSWQNLATVAASVGGAGILSFESLGGGGTLTANRQKLTATTVVDDTGPATPLFIGSVDTHTLNITDVSSSNAITTTKKGIITRQWFLNFKSMWDGVFSNATPTNNRYTFNFAVTPNADLAANLGEVALRWDLLYCRNLNLKGGAQTLAAEGAGTTILSGYRLNGDTNDRVSVGINANSPSIRLGSGLAAADCTIYRAGAANLVLNVTDGVDTYGIDLSIGSVLSIGKAGTKWIQSNQYGSVRLGETSQAWPSNLLPNITLRNTAFSYPVSSDGYNNLNLPAYDSGTHPLFTLRGTKAGLNGGGALAFARSELASLPIAAIWAKAGAVGSGCSGLEFYVGNADNTWPGLAGSVKSGGFWQLGDSASPAFKVIKKQMTLAAGTSSISLVINDVDTTKVKAITGTASNLEDVMPIPGRDSINFPTKEFTLHTEFSGGSTRLVCRYVNSSDASSTTTALQQTITAYLYLEA